MSDNNSLWITTRYPEPYKDVIVFDLYSGTHIAYYDNIMNTFYDKQTGEPLSYVSSWMSQPVPPRTALPLRQSVGSRYIPNVKVVTKEDTNDKNNRRNT